MFFESDLIFGGVKLDPMILDGNESIVAEAGEDGGSLALSCNTVSCSKVLGIGSQDAETVESKGDIFSSISGTVFLFFSICIILKTDNSLCFTRI